MSSTHSDRTTPEATVPSVPSPSRASAALRCSGLVKHYEDVVAVDGLDLRVEPGECFGLLGPNGAGKTTTVEIFEGLTEPTAGVVEVLGEPWRGDGRGLRERIGVQLQETKFPEKLRVAEVARLWRSFYRSGIEPDEVLRRVDLVDKQNAFVRDLSGGQKQRLSLACALVGDPEVLFLDEPTTGLDPGSRRQIWAIVEDLKRRGRTILLTTHYMEEADRLSDRVAVIDRGLLLAQGTPAQLIATLGAEHVVELVTGAIEPEAFETLPGVEKVDRVEGSWRLTVREVAPVLGPLLALLDRRGLSAERLATHHATLEDVFLSLAGRGLTDEADRQ